MNSIELKEILMAEGYNSKHFSFDRRSPPLEGYILEMTGPRWTVFYFERGSTRDIANFESEYDACDYLYEKIKEGYGSVVRPIAH